MERQEITYRALIFALLALGLPALVLADTYVGVEYVATSNQKINGDSNVQSGVGLGMTGGAHWSLFEPLGLGHGVEASLQFASYRRTNSPNSYSATFLHLNYVPSWQLIVMRLDFPVGFVVISAADDYQKTAKEFGVRTSFHELGFVVPYIHVRWMSVDSDNRTIMASTGVNFFF